MGAFCMVAYPLLYWKMSNGSSRLKNWALSGLTAWAVVMHTLTGSRTSMITALLGLMVWCAVQRKPIRLMVLSGVAALGVLLITIFQPPNLYREADRGMAGLTGRPEIWTAALTLAAEQPLQGFGYEVGGKIFEDPRFQNRELGLWVGSARVSLHNGYLSALVGLGIPGFLILHAALLLPFWRCRSAPADPCKPLVFGVLAMCLTANLTESLIGSPAAITSVVLWMLWVVAGRLAPRRIHVGGETAVDGRPVFGRTRE
jgi:O-antigen ligase